MYVEKEKRKFSHQTKKVYLFDICDSDNNVIVSTMKTVDLKLLILYM
jgi:hypothetical protein